MNLERFGITTGQIRSHSGGELVHNGGWYDISGAKVGWGDLTEDDLRRISAELREGEKFIVLGEQDSFWKFVRRPGPIGALADVDTATEQNPGLDHVRECARWVVVPGQIYHICPYSSDFGETEFNGLRFITLKDSSSVLGPAGNLP